MGSSVSCFGVRIGLRAGAASGLAILTSWLPRAVKPGSATVVDALDSRGRVFPWAEALAIRRNGGMEAAQPHTPETLGLTIGRKSVPVRMVVLTSFEEGKRPRPRRLSPAAGALGLLEHTLPAQARPRATLRALASAVSGAQVIRGLS